MQILHERMVDTPDLAARYFDGVAIRRQLRIMPADPAGTLACRTYTAHGERLHIQSEYLCLPRHPVLRVAQIADNYDAFSCQGGRVKIRRWEDLPRIAVDLHAPFFVEHDDVIVDEEV